VRSKIIYRPSGDRYNCFKQVRIHYLAIRYSRGAVDCPGEAVFRVCCVWLRTLIAEFFDNVKVLDYISAAPQCIVVYEKVRALLEAIENSRGMAHPASLPLRRHRDHVHFTRACSSASTVNDNNIN